MSEKKNVEIEEVAEKGWADSHGKTAANSERKAPGKAIPKKDEKAEK